MPVVFHLTKLCLMVRSTPVSQTARPTNRVNTYPSGMPPLPSLGINARAKCNYCKKGTLELRQHIESYVHYKRSKAGHVDIE